MDIQIVDGSSQDSNNVITLEDGDDCESTKMEEPDEFTLITWNIDGLSDKNLIIRTKGACDIVNKIKTDVVFFQEVVPESESMISRMLTDYKLIYGRTGDQYIGEYYTVTCLREKTVKHLDHKIIDFEYTDMGRNIIDVNVIISGTKLRFLNTHLESTREGAINRQRQLQKCFQLVNSSPQDVSVLFGGDLNLRDTEVTSLGGPNSKIKDVWQLTGSRKECQFTWDMTRNDNLKLEAMGRNGFKPRFRFDRLYFRDSIPSEIAPEYFGLIGIERLKPHVCFPSDHWGILAAFKFLK